MAVPASTIKATIVAWNSLTWSASSTPGGPVRVRWAWEFGSTADRTGGDVYSQQVFPTGGKFVVRVTLREAPIPAIGDKSNMTVTYKTKDSTRQRPFVGMKFMGIQASQDQESLGEDEMVFEHESADGTTPPVS